ANDRERFPLNCVKWRYADDFCAFEGGRLPTAAQLEYAASVAGRSAKTAYAWGDDEPTCDRAVYGRWDDDATGGTECASRGIGPVAVDQLATPNGDVTPTFGLVGLGGGMSAWTRDAAVPYEAACWARAPLHDPTCEYPGALVREARGASWQGLAS